MEALIPFKKNEVNQCPFCGEFAFYMLKESARYIWFKCHACPCERRYNNPKDPEQKSLFK